MTSYSYVHLRERVTVMPSKSADGGVFVNLAGTDCGVHVQAADLPAFIAGICEQAPDAAPIVLERPSDIAVAVGHYVGGCKVFADGGAVRLQATERHQSKEYWFTRLTPATARQLAAHLAARADAVDAEPDPAAVDALAEILHEQREHCPGAGEIDRRYALAVLRAGYKPPGGEM